LVLRRDAMQCSCAAAPAYWIADHPIMAKRKKAAKKVKKAAKKKKR
jgi:hypothetical protein